MNEKVEIKFKFFAGSSRKGEWAGIHYYSPHVPAIYEQRGDIAAVLSLSGPANFDSSKAGNLLIDYLHETYFESEVESSLHAIEDAVDKVKERLVDFMVNDEVSSEAGVEISLVAASIQGNFLYIAQIGDAKILGYRNGELVDFSEHLKTSGKAHIKVGSTILDKDDRLLLITAEANFNLNENEKKHILEEFKLDTIEAKNFSNEALVSTLLLGLEVEEKFEVARSQEPELIEESVEVVSSAVQSVEDSVQDETYEKQMVGIKEESNEVKTEISEIAPDTKAVKGKLKFDIKKVGQHLNRIKRDHRTKTFIYILSSIAAGIVAFLVKFGKIFWKDILRMEPGLYLRSANRKDVNWRPMIFLSIILIVGGIVIFKSIQAKNEKQKLESENRLAVEKVNKDFDALSAEIDILSKTVGKEDEKLQKLNSLEELDQVLVQVSLEDYADEKTELEKKIDNYENKLLRKIVVSDAVIIKDFGIYEGSDPIDFTIFADTIFVADKGGGKLLGMDFEGGNVKSLAENLQNPRGVSIYEGQELVFVDDNEERGVGVIKLESSQLERLPGLSKSRLGNINETTIYKVADNDVRLYATREGTKELIQMRRGTNSFGLPELRLNKADFTNLVDVEVNNGRIYVLSEGQGVRRFLGDNEFGNTISGMVEGDTWNTASSMYVDADYIYLGDSENKRILVFTKSRADNADILDFVAQYDLSQIDGSGSIREVMSGGNKLYVLGGTKLIELNLDQLKDFVY